MSIHPTWRADDIVMPLEADGDPPDMIEEIHWLRQEVATSRNLLDTEKEVSEMRGRQSNQWHDKWERLRPLLTEAKAWRHYCSGDPMNNKLIDLIDEWTEAEGRGLR